MNDEPLSVERKALRINLDPAKYGTFAEIGAGQEVGSNFFQAGGAAGTVAKTISAYDMKFSDSIYGDAGRYVSRQRLVQMLKHEFDLLDEPIRCPWGGYHLLRLCQHCRCTKLQQNKRMPWMDGDTPSTGT